MWNKPWKLREGFLVGLGLIVTGLLLQFAVGPLDWGLFSFPANLIVLVVFLFLVGVVFFFRGRVYAFRFLGSHLSAIPALVYAAVLTAVMGLTRQVPATARPADFLGITRMLSFWPFVLVYVWMALILGQAVLKKLLRPQWRDLPFLLSHLGLLVVMVCGTLGNADLKRLKMTVATDGPEWRAVDDDGKVHELPVAIQLERFTIEEYPPKLVLVDNHTGNPVGGSRAETLLLDSTFVEGQLGDWLVRLDKCFEYAVPVMQEDATAYEPWAHSGAVTAVRVDVKWHPERPVKRVSAEAAGWVTCGSYLFPPQMLKVDKNLSVAMLPREPRRYVSRVEILTQTGKRVKTDILVNKPFSIDGWKIYQLSYDSDRGRWSEVSVLELVRDPWLPVVYTGIFMLLLGALGMFWYKK